MSGGKPEHLRVGRRGETGMTALACVRRVVRQVGIQGEVR